MVLFCFRPMWRARTRHLRQPPSRPLAGVPPTSPRWRTPVSTVWCCCFPTEMVKCLHWQPIHIVFLVAVHSFALTRCVVFAETVVAESVVVIKKLLQTQPTQHSEIIKHMAKLFDNITVWFIFFSLCTFDFFVFVQNEILRTNWHEITYFCQHAELVCCPNLQVPMARASILWLMGEYCERVPKIAPDVLRKIAKTFTAEEDIVKLQTVNLAAKLYLTNSKQVQHRFHCQAWFILLIWTSFWMKYLSSFKER